jgi:8-oxo-dGTP diphosphatase
MNLPKVGLAVIIKNGGKILLGKRIGAHDSGTWSFPGGHLEFKESLENCATRETLEETGLKIENPKFLTITNDIFEKDNKHYITIFMRADSFSGIPEIKEPNKCEEWLWFSPQELPENLMTPIKNLLKQNPSILD